MVSKLATKFEETEINLIPEEWSNLELREFAELAKDAYLPNKSEDIPYIGLEHIDQQTLSLNSIGKSLDVKSNKFRFKDGDILFGKLRPYFRKVYRPKFSGICSTDIWVVRVREGFDQGWLFYLLASEDFVNSASGGSGGTRMPRADWNHLKNTLWPTPNLVRQKQIAEIISSLDDKIELNRKINASLEDIASALFKRWFIDFEFPNENGKPYKSSGGKMLDFGLGEIPVRWKQGNFDEIINERTERVGKNDKDVVVLSAINSSDLVKSEDYFNKQVFSKSLTKYKLVMKFDFAYNPSRINIGSIGMLEDDNQGAVSPIYVVFRPKNCYYYFIQNILRFGIIKKYIEQFASGSVRQALSFKDFALIPIVIPPVDLLKKFNDFEFSLKKERLEKNDENDLLIAIRDSLLPRLMSGKIRVK